MKEKHYIRLMAIVFGLVFACVCGVIAYRTLHPDQTQPLLKWKQTTPGNRHDIAQELIRDRTLIGMNEADVIVALGTPAYHLTFDDEIRTGYSVGFPGSVINNAITPDECYLELTYVGDVVVEAAIHAGPPTKKR